LRVGGHQGHTPGEFRVGSVEPSAVGLPLRPVGAVHILIRRSLEQPYDSRLTSPTTLSMRRQRAPS